MYLLLAVGITWPLVQHLDASFVGYPTIDAFDTILLRGVVSDLLLQHPLSIPHSPDIYHPDGYNILQLVPNLLDHLLGGILGLFFIFPTSDNLFWLLLIVGNGVAAHCLGYQLTRRHSSAFLVGVAYATSENLLREINLHHAPQALSPWAPLYLAAILRSTTTEGRKKDSVMAGFWMALSGITYWYTAIFLAIGTLPILWVRRHQWKRFLLPAFSALLIASPFLLPYAIHLDALPLAFPDQAPYASQDFAGVPTSQAFVTEHANDLALPWRSTPIDTSNRIGFVLLLAVFLSIRNGSQRTFLWIAGIGFLFALGPYLRWGEEVVLVGNQPIALPFRWLSAASPLFERLTWPERWGLLIALGLAAAAARAPRPRLFAVLIVLETVLFSRNAPLQNTLLSGQEAWRRLEATDGAVLELPLSRTHRQAPFIGLHARLHQRPIVNPILQPPGSRKPVSWEAQWGPTTPIRQWLDSMGTTTPLDSENDAMLKMLIQHDIGAIALDVGPGSDLRQSEARFSTWKNNLSRALGSPEDLGSLLIWWTKPPQWKGSHTLSWRGKSVATGSQWRKARAIERSSSTHSSSSNDHLIEQLPLD